MMEINTYCVKCKRRSPVVDVRVGNEEDPVQVSMQLCYECFEKDFNKDADDSVYYLENDEDVNTDLQVDEFDNTFASY